ncbi:MAG: response regulator transcription factor [Bacteroidales bacterium]|nr:response regulator transcription factor [Bacteroidales bacterium]MBR5063546.1 response regulator transcription factor [Bacteroidales bacterium]
MRNLRCIVVDDEPLAVKMLEGFVERTPFLELEASFNDPVEALSAIRERKPELAFLDIQMPDLDGMELSRMVPQETRIVFTTAFKQYAFESYEVSALDFLLKPIRYQKFLEAAEKAREWFSLKEAAEAAPAEAERTSVFIKVDGALRKVELADIQYVEGMRDYVMIHVASSARPIVTHMTMKAAEELLPAQTFMRIHRSFIVALPHITSFSPTGDLKVGDALLHVSDAFRPAFDAYLKDHSLV